MVNLVAFDLVDSALDAVSSSSWIFLAAATAAAISARFCSFAEAVATDFLLPFLIWPLGLCKQSQNGHVSIGTSRSEHVDAAGPAL